MYGTKKSTGKETGKMHLRSLASFQEVVLMHLKHAIFQLHFGIFKDFSFAHTFSHKEFLRSFQ